MEEIRWPQSRSPRSDLRYVRAPQPITYPEEEQLPESKIHLEVRTFLYKLLQFALGADHSVGSEQFVYWNAADSSRVVAPDVFVKLGVPDTNFRTWKTWERGGAPDLAVEIVSATERGEGLLDEKLACYHELGVRELVCFDAELGPGHRLRVWDRVEEDLVERVITDDDTPCLTLGLTWTLRVLPALGGDVLGLRLSDDQGRLLDTREERSEAARLEEAEGRRIEAEARASAEARVRELEAELRRRRG